MMRATTITVILLLALAVPAGEAAAQLASEDEAVQVARSWVASVVESRGSWGDSETATLMPAQELVYEGRRVGTMFEVDPTGFVVVSLRREFAPVKCYSEDSRLDPSAPDGPSDLLRSRMARIIEGVEALTGQAIEDVHTAELAAMLEIDYRKSWDRLGRRAVEVPKGGRSARGDYQEGEILVPAIWDQGPPYNDDCPELGCAWYPPYNSNAPVGCVATASAQIMYYWMWPPEGEGSPYSDPYDWGNMFDECFWSVFDGCFKETGDTTFACMTQAQIDAVAELCEEIGQAVGMSYGCSGSGANTGDMESVLENQYRYAPACARVNRPDMTAAEWFAAIQTECNANRPMLYRILGHAILCDGWQIAGDAQYHMNYGGADSHNAWYTLDALYYPAGGSPDDEYMLRYIAPANAVPSTFSGSFSLPSYPFRYVTTDSQGSSATFAAGHRFQFRPDAVVSCASGHVTVEGTSTNESLFFTRADQSRGMKVSGGAMKLLPGGEVRMP